MNDDKFFLTYNQQMKKLRNDKHILCNGSSHKKILVRLAILILLTGTKILLSVGVIIMVIIVIYLAPLSASFTL